MNKLALCTLLVALVSVSSAAQAKCFGFRGKDVRVCVEGHDNAARRRATEVCDSVADGDCSISGDSGSTCQRSSSVRCYDESGSEQRRIELED